MNTSTTAPGEKRVYEGSTLAPNFPKVNIVKSKDAKGPFSFNDVPIIRYFAVVFALPWQQQLVFSKLLVFPVDAR